MMNSQEVAQVLATDIDIGSRVHVTEIPRISINGRHLKRWRLPGGGVIEHIIMDEARRKPPEVVPANTGGVPGIPGVNAPIK
jgi:hypothetical protein